MKFDFTKMHGAGNDFIVAFDTSGKWPRLADTIRELCDRKRGIGADGLILLSRNPDKKIPFKMAYFNSDGSYAGMCGNGLRCAALFCYNNLDSAKNLKLLTASGPLETSILSKNTVRVKIPISGAFRKIVIDGDEMYFGNTGVPHLVKPVRAINRVNVSEEGGKLRRHKIFSPEGTNVNFISLPEKGTAAPCEIRTYERGVEDETSACGTGITASAICLLTFFRRKPPFDFLTMGGDILTVEFREYDNILNTPETAYLTGPAVEVFSGTILI
ncbi:MAG: diaminopimelate epimerase [Victivallales bacterium]|jgi:diaminopimelate epimerase